MDSLRERLGTALPNGARAACAYGHRHPHGCRETACPYFVHGIGSPCTVTGRHIRGHIPDSY